MHIWKRYNYYDFPNVIEGIRRSDVFLLHGGGNLGDIWFHFQSFRESILERFPNNQVIFLPQTVHFESRERQAASLRKMSRHRHLHIFVRDHISLAQLQNGGLECVSAAPDMAHALAGVLKPSKNATAESTLKLVRQDKEASTQPNVLNSTAQACIDWDHGTFSAYRKLAHRAIVNFVKGMGRYGPPADLHKLWYWHRDKMIQDGVDLFSGYETIVTNRLHAMILGLLLSRNVTAWDNNYGKLSSYYDAWLQNLPQLNFCQTLSPRAQQPQTVAV